MPISIGSSANPASTRKEGRFSGLTVLPDLRSPASVTTIVSLGKIIDLEACLGELLPSTLGFKQERF